MAASKTTPLPKPGRYTCKDVYTRAGEGQYAPGETIDLTAEEIKAFVDSKTKEFDPVAFQAAFEPA